VSVVKCVIRSRVVQMNGLVNCTPVDIVLLAEVGAMESSLAVLGLRRASSSAICRRAVDVNEEETLTSLALSPLSVGDQDSVDGKEQYRRSQVCLCSFTS
jgi:uncharacterized protein (DUF39 family)